MFKVRTKKILRDILSRKGRSLMVILSIIVGVFGVTTMVSISDLVRTQAKEDIKPEHMSHTQVFVISGGQSLNAEDNRAYLDTLADLPGVVDVEGEAVYPVEWTNDGSQRDAVLFGFSEPLTEANLQSPSRIIKGRYPETGVHEIAVEPRFAEVYNLEVGDKLTFANTDNEEWTIVGIIVHPYVAQYPSNQMTILVDQRIFANYADAQHIVGFTGLSSIFIRYETTSQAKDGLGTLVDAVSRETPYVVAYTYQDDPENSFANSIIEDMSGVLNAVGLVIILISGFLVTNVMNTVIMEQRRQIGAMKSLGATFWDTFRIYGGMALVFGVFGTGIGLVLAIPVAASTARPFGTSLLVYIEGTQISPRGIGIGVVLGLVVPILAAIFPVWQASRISILEAMTDIGIASDWGTSRLSRFVGRLPLPLIFIQASNNIIKKKERLALTILTLTAAVGAFIAATAIMDSISNYMDSLNGIHDYEIRMILQHPDDYNQIVNLLDEEVDGVIAVYPGLDVSASVPGFVSNAPFREGSNQVTVAGFDSATSTYKFDLLEGASWQENSTREGVIITRPLADKLDKQAGDTLELTINGQDLSYEIIGVDAYPFDNIYMDWQELAQIAGYVDDAGAPLVGAAYILLDNAEIDAVDDKIEEISALLSTRDIQGIYFNQPYALKVSADQGTTLGMIFQMMAMVTAAVSAIGLFGAQSMAVLERQKEIGIMRSVGARSRTIMGQFMLEGIIIGILAWLGAIPFSIWMSQAFLGVLPVDYMLLIYPPQLVLFGLANVLVIVTVASLWPSLMASRKTIADILRYQ